MRESSGAGEVEIEDYVDGVVGIVGGESGEVIDAEESALGGVVEGTVAAGFGDANVFDGAVTIDGEGDSGFGPASGTNGGIDGILHPVLTYVAFDGFDVPGVARGEITAALALHGDAAIERAGSVGIAAGEIHLAALAVGDSVFRRRSFLFEHLRFVAGRKGFLFFEFGNIGGVGFGLGLFGFRFFLIQTFGGVDGFAIGGVGGGRHGDACAGDETDLYTGFASADAAPGIAGVLDPDADEKKDGERDVEVDGVGEVSFEGKRVEVVDGL